MHWTFAVLAAAAITLTGCSSSPDRRGEALSASDQAVIAKAIEHERWYVFLEERRSEAPDGDAWSRGTRWYKFRFGADWNAEFARGNGENPKHSELEIALVQRNLEKTEEDRVVLLNELGPRISAWLEPGHLEAYAVAPRDDRDGDAASR